MKPAFASYLKTCLSIFPPVCIIIQCVWILKRQWKVCMFLPSCVYARSERAAKSWEAIVIPSLHMTFLTAQERRKLSPCLFLSIKPKFSVCSFSWYDFTSQNFKDNKLPLRFLMRPNGTQNSNARFYFLVWPCQDTANGHSPQEKRQPEENDWTKEPHLFTVGRKKSAAHPLLTGLTVHHITVSLRGRQEKPKQAWLPLNCFLRQDALSSGRSSDVAMCQQNHFAHTVMLVPQYLDNDSTVFFVLMFLMFF